MLLKSRISNLLIHSDEWKAARTGRLFTSSSIHKICGEKGLGETGLSHISLKVFETLSGTSTDVELDTDSVRHGIVYEPEATRKFGINKGVDFLVTQKMINGETADEASTPDGLMIRKESIDTLKLDVSTLETKCYQPLKHLQCCLCDTPEQIKKVDRPAYFQVLHQLIVCDCLNGYLVYYHPDLPADKGQMKIIEFRKIHLIEDLKMINNRKAEARNEFKRIFDKLTS